MSADTHLTRGCCDDEPDYLADKPRGRCPSCNHVLMTRTFHPGTEDATSVLACFCEWWDLALDEDDNRERYAATRMADARTEEKIVRETRKYGVRREV